MICVVTLFSIFGVSCVRQAFASFDRESRYFRAMAIACSPVELSGTAGPLAIISRGSPKISLSTILNIFAGAQARAKRPPLTAESLLRIVFISTISAPPASRLFVISCSSGAGDQRFFEQSASPSGEKEQNRVLVGEILHHRQYFFCGSEATLIRYRMTGFVAGNSGNRAADMPVFCDHNALIYTTKRSDSRMRHLPGGFSDSH